MKKVTVNDDAAGNVKGWNPDGVTNSFIIDEPLVDPEESAVIINFITGFNPPAVCGVRLGDAFFQVYCPTETPNDFEILQYAIINLPPNVVT